MNGRIVSRAGGGELRFARPGLVLACCIVAGLALRVVYVARGHFYLDSAFYLQAARAVTEGKLPYRDFFFVQGPVYPYLYGATRLLLLPLLGSATLVARLTSTLFGIGACGLAALTARRLGGAGAGLLALLLTFPNSYLAYDYAVEKLYAPTAFAVALAAWLAAIPTPVGGRVARGRYVGAAIALAIATGLRLTILPAIGALALLVLAQAPRKREVLWPVLAFGATLAAIFLPFALAAPERFRYHMMGIHESATGASPYHFGMRNKVLVVLSMTRDNQLLALLVVVGLPALLWHVAKGNWKLENLWDDAAAAFLWLLAASIAAANFAANWVHASYQTVMVPVLAAAVAVTCARLAPLVVDARARRGVAALLLVGALLQPVAYGRKELWSHDARVLSPYAPELVALIRQHAGPDEPVLMFNAAFAVEAGRPILRGGEGFPFTFTPDWDAARCRAWPSLDGALLVEAFDRRTPAVVALVADQFRTGFPGFVPQPEGRDAPMWAALERGYLLEARVPNPDATDNDVLFYVRR